MKRSVIALLHLGYWLLYILLVLFILLAMIANSHNGPATPLHLFHGLFFSAFGYLTLISALIGFYSFYFILFPKYLKRKKILALIFSGFLISVLSPLIVEPLLAFTADPKFLFSAGWDSAIAIGFVISFLTLIHGIIALVMRGFIAWYGDIKLKEELSKKNYETELALVKSQINPHFLFNTLNNIDVLIEKDAKKASAYLNKLSDIMRFMLYEVKSEKISLAKELTYIEKYIELQKIRTSVPNYVNYSVEGEIGNVVIEPMLFIPFIENAFKHAETKKTENAITIHLLVEKDKIIFNCTNLYAEHSQPKIDHSGLGNELIQKRLMLLYAGKHELKITDENKIYKVKLTIER